MANFPNYVLADDLTMDYINTLIARNGWINATDQYPDQSLLIVQDLSGNQTWFSDLPRARDFLVTQYLIQLNS